MVANKTQVPPYHESIIRGKLVGKWQGAKEGITEPVEKLVSNKGLLMPRAVVSLENNEVLITVANATDKAVSLSADTVVAQVQPVNYISSPMNFNDIQGIQVESDGDIVLPDHLQKVLDGVDPSVTQVQRKRIAELLFESQDTFAVPGGKLGCTYVFKHEIDTGDAKPIKQPPRRVPLKQRKIEEEEIDKMLTEGVIEPSTSPWASGVVLVEKKDGSVRFCVDYRRINSVTKKDAYPLPRIDQSLDALSGAVWFITLDLASGYWQMEMAEKDKPKTAFATSKGLFQFKVMPFGLANAPASFERLMEHVLMGLQWQKCLIYLDDVIVFGKSFDEAMKNLVVILERFRKANLKLKAKKCSLFKKSVTYLGHVVSEEGISCDPAKIEAVQSWEAPTNKTEVQSFLGLAGYYRKFISHFSSIASPLYDLTKKNKEFVWSSECQKAFESLKGALTSHSILAYPREKGRFILDTDASGYGIGAVLSQLQDGQEKVIAYASKTLNKYQRRYCTTYRELLAVVTFIKQFHHYLYGQEFTVRTDHASLIWLKNFQNTVGVLCRWISTIETYSPTWEHRSGSLHLNADALSRKKPRRCKRDDCPDCTSPEYVMHAVQSVDPPRRSKRLAEKLATKQKTSEKEKEAEVTEQGLGSQVQEKNDCMQDLGS